MDQLSIVLLLLSDLDVCATVEAIEHRIRLRGLPARLEPLEYGYTLDCLPVNQSDDLRSKATTAFHRSHLKLVRVRH